MEGLLQDLRYGLRQLAQSPGFTVLAVLALALGIGSTTTIVSFAQATTLNLFRFRDPLGIVAVGRISPDGQKRQVHTSTYRF